MYKLIEKKKLDDLQAEGFLYEHNRTKAKICFVKCRDENKAFSISFRTPPKDSTGIAHILEHSVLCGSKKYPIKDPFVELAKGSLNTFLNAMTFPDKTMYPIASVNDKDFHNLVDVYLDAVFNPNIYENRKIFEQEGWHYELNSKDEDISYKGVVYNEMKGAYSSTEQVLFRSIQQELFENHVYGIDSGGNPLDIPKLSYEQFLEFHKKYYHPSNSYIFYYGDVDIEKELEYLNEEYLKNYDYLKVESEIPLMQRLKDSKDVLLKYPIAPDEDEKNKYYFSYNFLLKESTEVIDSILFDLLEYLLIEAPGAPIKKALLDANIGEDIFADYDSSKREGTFSIVAKNVDILQKEKFKQIIEHQIIEIIKNGFDSKRLEAAINKYEFKAKEGDYGIYPKGIIFAINAMDTWLYEGSPFDNFEYDKLFKEVRSEISKGRIEEILKECFVENKHNVFLTLEPDKKDKEQREKIVEQELKNYQKQLTNEEKDELIAKTKELIEYQNEKDEIEDLEKLPLLKISDIERDNKKFEFKKKMIKDTKLLMHETNANDIVYIKASFDVSFVEEETLAMLSLLANVLIKLSTKNKKYAKLADEINLYTGGISSSLAVYEHKKSNKYYTPRLEITAKSFEHNLGKVFELIKEIITETDFTDIDRLRELINEKKSRLQMSISASGHSYAMLRASSYYSKIGSYNDKVKGIEYYETICKWQNYNDEKILELGYFLKKILEKIISSDRLTIGITASQKYMKGIEKSCEDFIKQIPYKYMEVKRSDITLNKSTNEGFMTTDDVCYVASVANFKNYGFEYSGALKVLNKIINLDYLWNEIRVKGGAYGAMAGVSTNGSMYFTSYRDPNLEETLTVYDKIEEYINNIELDDRELSKYIIGTISSMDKPLTPSLENIKMLSLYYSEFTNEEVLQRRHEVLDTTLEQLKENANLYKKAMENKYICVIGNDKKVENTKNIFEKISRLS